MQRPNRLQIKNESGQLKTLPEGRRHFQDLDGSGPLLMLGLGPAPLQAAEYFPDEGTIYYIECPEAEKQIAALKSLPEKFVQISPKELNSRDFHTVFYSPGKKMFPSFWGPLLAELVLRKSGACKKTRNRTVWLPGDENSLLLPELSGALADAGFSYRVIAPDAMRKDLLSLLNRELPELLISVNFNGLDSYGETYFMLREAGVKVVVWMVDNPFHILSGIRSEYWKKVPLMMTDHWFIPRLKQLGAAKTAHLPLATDTGIFNPQVVKFPGLAEKVVFVGRSKFPGKDTFFSGCSFTQEDLEKAQAAIESGTKPDFGWWADQYGESELIPDRQIRQTGFRAEQSGLLWRTTMLKKISERLTIFGDDGWNDFFDNADLRPPVDYYTALPSIYAGAGISINLTSPLLPCGLTQRNFDVWAAGGFLLSDRTGGMSIFPDDLLDECTFTHPAEIPALCDKFLTQPNLRKTLSKIWHQVIIKEHTYSDRITKLLNFIT